jgi:heme/flavin dehydrogenase (mycofactocin system)
MRKIENPWKQNPWFESVAVAQRRARKRLPAPVYNALAAGSERGQTVNDNEAAFRELGLAPHAAGNPATRSLATRVLGQDLTLPVLISPTGVQAVHPDGEIAVARAATNAGTLMGLSNFASKPVEKVVEANPRTLFQMYWTGNRDIMVQRMQRAHSAGVIGLIVTTDWSFSVGRDWGSPEIPERIDLRAKLRNAPHLACKPRWAWAFARAGIPDLTAPNLTKPGEPAPTFFGAYYEWMSTPPPSWEDIAWAREQWQQISGTPFVLKGVSRVDDAQRAVDSGVDALSVSNHGGNNLDGTPGAIRMLEPVAEAVGQQVEVLFDGGIRRGSDVVKALALGAKAVLIGRAYLWGLAANGQAGVENVLDVLRMGIDSTEWLGRKAYYGTGSATLAARHGDYLAPAVLSPTYALAAAAILARRRSAIPLVAWALVRGRREVRRALPEVRTAGPIATKAAVRGLGWAVRQETALLLRHWWPATAIGALLSASARRALATAVLIDVAVVHHELDDLPRRDLAAHVVARWLDGMAYGAGLWWGALRARSVRALVPRWVVRRRG